MFCVTQIVFLNGNKYTGDFQNDKRSGHGHFHWHSTGNSYEGEFHNDKRTGFVTVSFEDDMVLPFFFLF